MKKAVKIILVNKKNEVLLQLRDNKHSHAGHWALFGGHLEGSETPEEALIREIKEEIHYSINTWRFIEESRVKDFGKVYWFQGVINAKLSDLDLTEGDDFNFFTYEEILKLELAPESRKRLIEYFRNRNT